MKTHLFACLAIGLLSAAFARADYSFKEPFSRTAAFNPSGKVSLENVNGSITIEGWDRNEISIEGEKSAQSEEELKQIELTLNVSESAAEIRVRLPKRTGLFQSGTIRAAVSFVLKVPATASLRSIHTVNSNVTLEGLRGGSRVETVNGRIGAKGMAGEVRLSTVNGPVSAELTQVAAAEDVRLKSVNGTIRLSLPADVHADVHASTVNGGIGCEFPLAVEGRFGPKHLSGKLGGGGPDVRAETVNGGIHISKT